MLGFVLAYTLVWLFNASLNASFGYVLTKLWPVKVGTITLDVVPSAWCWVVSTCCCAHVLVAIVHL